MAKPTLIPPTPEEDEAINRGIAADPDNPELTDDDFARLVPVDDASVAPEIAAAIRRVRGPQRAPTKIMIALRIDRDVAERWRASGRGWQSRMNDVLRKAAPD